jgi:hypothetical protein
VSEAGSTKSRLPSSTDAFMIGLAAAPSSNTWLTSIVSAFGVWCGMLLRVQYNPMYAHADGSSENVDSSNSVATGGASRDFAEAQNRTCSRLLAWRVRIFGCVFRILGSCSRFRSHFQWCHLLIRVPQPQNTGTFKNMPCQHTRQHTIPFYRNASNLRDGVCL